MIEILTLSGALLFGSLAFYAFWVSSFILIFVLAFLAEESHWVWATVALIAWGFLLKITNVVNILAYTHDHYWNVIELVNIYLLIGIVYSCFEWYLLCVKAKKRFINTRKDYPHSTVESFRPIPGQHKELIMTWTYLWPFVLISHLVTDGLRKICTLLSDSLNGVYESISKKIWDGI